MTAIIFSVIILVIGFVLFFSFLGKKKTQNVVLGSTGERVTAETRPMRKFAFLPLTLSIILSAVVIGSACMVSIPTGHTGVVTTFGYVENFTLDAGFHFKSPIQDVVCMDNRVRKASTSLSCFSSDIQEVQLAYTLNYQIKKSNAQELYRTVGIDYYGTVIVPNIAEAVKVVTARYTAEALVGSRDELGVAIEALLSEQLNGYNIEVVSTAIEDMDFTDAFTNAVESKQVAAQNKLQAEIEQAQKTMEAQQQAERAKIEAQAAAEVAKIQAEADLEVTKIQADAAEYAGQKEAAKNKAIAEFLTPELLQYYLIQEWDGKYPETYVGSDKVNTILNTGK